ARLPPPSPILSVIANTSDVYSSPATPNKEGISANTAPRGTVPGPCRTLEWTTWPAAPTVLAPPRRRLISL
ncbi:MAG TPA: hypothetical protein VIQ74_02985, partial [Gemmatimonadaceae bacterium]